MVKMAKKPKTVNVIKPGSKPLSRLRNRINPTRLAIVITKMIVNLMMLEMILDGFKGASACS